MKKLFVFIVFLFAFLIFPRPSFASVIHSFDSQIVAHKNGQVDITETINYDFESVEHHGIYRNIPLYAKVGDLYRIYRIENIKILRDSAPEQFTTSQTSDQITFKIGNPDKTMIGDHVYKISYIVQNAVGSNFADHDEIYWSATGNDWDVGIEKATETISTDFSVSFTKLICYQGPYGSKDRSCVISANSASTSGPQSAGDGLTAIAVYPVGTFPKSILSSSPPQTFSDKVLSLIFQNYWLIWIFLNVILSPVLIYWYEKHKNKTRFGPPSVNFDIPKDEKGVALPPAIAGTIDSAMLARDDVTATIFDLAIRRYIKLTDTKKVRPLAPDTTTQTITKLKDAGAEFFPHEQDLFNFLFDGRDTVSLSDLKAQRQSFYETFQDMEKHVFETLKEKGYYTKNPKTQRVIFWILTIGSLVSLNIILGGVFLFFSKKLNGRTTLGDQVDYRIDGLKLFLKAMDPEYNWQAEKLVTLEQMIPYAMALGYIDKFMKELKIIKPDYNPSWYAGYAAGSFFSNYSGFYSSFSTTVAPSSSSGAGGGGFSGGGGGGGGGGGW